MIHRCRRLHQVPALVALARVPAHHFRHPATRALALRRPTRGGEGGREVAVVEDVDRQVRLPHRRTLRVPDPVAALARGVRLPIVVETRLARIAGLQVALAHRHPTSMMRESLATLLLPVKILEMEVTVDAVERNADASEAAVCLRNRLHLLQVEETDESARDGSVLTHRRDRGKYPSLPE